MSDPASIARQYLDAAPRRGFDKCRQLFHPQYSYAGGDGQRQEGAEAGIAVADMMTTAFPGIELEIKKTHVAGDGEVWSSTAYYYRTDQTPELQSARYSTVQRPDS